MIIIPKHGTLTFEQCAQILTLSQRNYGPFILPNETAQERNTRHEENRNIMREAIANGKLDTVILDFDENEINFFDIKDFLRWATKRGTYTLPKEIHQQLVDIYKEQKNKEFIQKKQKKGEYSTPEMVLMDMAINEFWLDFIEGETVPPKKDVVVPFIIEKAKKDLKIKDFSENMANSIDSIIRHPSARRGGNKRI